ncbi:hypothetical protein AAFF_G00285370 [Aldrovandia affinis]|uniref:Uncharacterized protein n=1 Tax=Aldrovandia affinis TaxID=143900 RepID=A0AAD7TAD4_9TELE|nr:hypothetical protein AAFF_G00285370 [Aldrovandia affinis]
MPCPELRPSDAGPDRLDPALVLTRPVELASVQKPAVQHGHRPRRPFGHVPNPAMRQLPIDSSCRRRLEDTAAECDRRTGGKRQRTSPIAG